MNSQHVKLGVALVLLAAAGTVFGIWFTTPNYDGEDLPEGTFWLCRNKDCDQGEFHLTLAELKKQKLPNGLVPCPKCEVPKTVRAMQCPHCKASYEPGVHGRIPDNCPECNERLLP